MQPQCWRPVLASELKAQALAAVQEIVAALPDPASAELQDASLSGGASGLAVLCAYLSRVGLDDDENATQFLARAFAAVAATPMSSSLYSGFTGIAWTAAHLQAQLMDTDAAADPCAEIDRALLDYLSCSPWDGDYDLINGLVGIGVYALERLPRASARACLALVVERLAETAEHNADGITWHTRPHLLPKYQREQCPAGYYNLGLAHGMPGGVALLGAVCAAGVAREHARTLLDGAVAWLLRQRLNADMQSSFSSWLSLGAETDDCRLAWCYGDAGVAAALFVAARAVGEAVWEREALTIARRAAQRPPESAGVRDAGLCHGAAGLGHIFNRLYQATGLEELGAAARYWFAQTLTHRRAGQGIAGFAARRRNEAGADEWVAEVGILEGAAGIALALLAAATNVEPAWDRILLVSLPGVWLSAPSDSRRIRLNRAERA